MSGDITHVAGGAACALAAVASIVSASATAAVLIENPRIVHSPASRPGASRTGGALEQITNVNRPSIRRKSTRDFVVSRCGLRRYLPLRTGSPGARRAD